MLDIFKDIFLTDLLRYLIVAGAAFLIFWVIGRQYFKKYLIQGQFPKSKKLREEFGYSMSTIVIFSLIGFGVDTASRAGYTQFYFDKSEYSEWWYYASFLAAVLIHDTYFYWSHRLMHHKKVYKHVHKVHHKFTNPSPWAAYAFHPIEAVLEAGIMPLIALILPIHINMIIAFLVYMILRNVLGHLGFELFPKGFASNKFLNWHATATHHNMHHEYFNCNYGFYFTWWDDLMKTTHENYEKEFDEAAAGDEVKENISVPVSQC